MVRLNFLKRKTITILLLFMALFLIPLSKQENQSVFATDKQQIDSLPVPKDTENFSNDWLLSKINDLRSDLDARNKRFNKRVNPSKEFLETPVAYQAVESDNSINLDFDDVALKDMDLTDQDPDFQKVEGGITDIRATVGKSQIIQFAQPIKRLSITDPSLVDLILLSPTQMIMNGKAGGVTTLIIWDEEDQPAFFDLYVQNDTTDLLDAFKHVAPDEPINIKVTDDGNVILSGTLSSSIVRDKIAQICQAYGYQLVDVSESPVPQVVLDLKVAEIARSITKNFSVLSKAAGWADISISPSFTTSPRDANGGIGAEWNANTLTGFTAAIFKPNARFSAILGMAQSRGLLNVLAEPKILTTHGRAAKFDAGNQVPVPTGVDQNGNLAYEYKDVGVKVDFTPWISEKSQRIELKIAPQVSEIDPSVTITQNDGTPIYGFRTRSTQQTVELENGETLMIAGLVRRRDTNSFTNPPFFDNIPIIGKLLSTSNFDKEESELVIMVTPRILKPGVYSEELGTSE